MKVLAIVSIIGFSLMTILSIMLGFMSGAVVGAFGGGLATGMTIWTFCEDD